MTVEKRRKKKVLVILAIVMVCCLVIVGTLAWLRYRTPEAINTFTLGEGVKIELKEEKYDKEENLNRVANFTPGMLLDKDPTVYIPAVEMNEYIAVTVRYYIEEVVEDNIIELREVKYNEFQNYAEIYSFKESVTGGAVAGSVISSEEEKSYKSPEPGFREGWVYNQDRSVFYYSFVTGSAVKPIVTTNPAVDDVAFKSVTSGAAITLFDKVKVSSKYNRYFDTTTTFEFDKYRYHEGTYTYREPRPSSYPQEVHKSEGQLKGFRIDVCAYAILAEDNTTTEKAKTDLNKLIQGHWADFGKQSR